MSALALSPWWWVGVALALAAVEAAVGSAALVCAALGALLTAAVVWIAPGLGLGAQVALFALASGLVLAVGRGAGPGRAARRAEARRAAELLVGREAEVLSFHFHEGQVSIDGVTWSARLEGASARTPAVGQRVRVVAADGKVVWVRSL